MIGWARVLLSGVCVGEQIDRLRSRSYLLGALCAGSAGGEGCAVEGVEADEVAGVEVGGGLAGIGEDAVDGECGVDDDGAGVAVGADDGALDAARAAVHGFDVLAAGGDDIDAPGGGVDGADDALAGAGGEGGDLVRLDAGEEVHEVVGVGEGEDDVGRRGGRCGVHGLEDGAGEGRVDGGGGGGVDHGLRG